jgi:hypothetical protein
MKGICTISFIGPTAPKAMRQISCAASRPPTHLRQRDHGPSQLNPSSIKRHRYRRGTLRSETKGQAGARPDRTRHPSQCCLIAVSPL